MLEDLKIDPEFASQIPPLTEEEFSQLEENILRDGTVLMPLITWNGVIVDGHNRYKIIQDHPELEYNTYEIPLMRYSLRIEMLLLPGSVRISWAAGI